MINLLDFKDKRIINICKALSIGQISVSVENIMKINNCSKRTVYNDLDEIEQRWNSMVDLQHNENMFYFNIKSIGNLQYIIRDIVSSSVPINLLYRILIDSHQPIEHYAIIINASESAITKSIRELNKMLSEFKITIKKDNGYYLYHENEHEFRYIISQMILDGYSAFDIITDKQQLLDTMDFIKLLASHYHYLIGDVPSTLISVLLRISILRERQGFNVEHEIINKKEHFYDDLYLTYPDEKKEHILGGVQTLYKLVFNEDKYHHLFPIVTSYVHPFLEKNHIELNYRDKRTLINIAVFTGIFNSSISAQYEPIVNRPNIYGRLFMQQNKAVYLDILNIIQTAETDYGVVLPQLINELIFYIYLEIPYIAIRQPLNIMIISDYGFNHAFILSQDISQHFSEHNYYPVALLHDDTQAINQVIAEEEIDLVISTSSPLKKLDAEFVIVNDFISGDDVKKIYNKIYLDK